jgi:hypothetical protein
MWQLVYLSFWHRDHSLPTATTIVFSVQKQMLKDCISIIGLEEASGGRFWYYNIVVSK